MNTQNQTCVVSITIEGVVEPVIFCGTVQLQDHGNGSYEYHGYKGNDVNWQPTCEEDFCWDAIAHTDVENELINQYVNQHTEKICSLLEAMWKYDGDVEENFES